MMSEYLIKSPNDAELSVYRRIGTDTLVVVINRPGKPTTRIFLEGALADDPPLAGDINVRVPPGDVACSTT